MESFRFELDHLNVAATFSAAEDLLMRITTTEKWLHAGVGVEVLPGFGAEPADSPMRKVVISFCVVTDVSPSILCVESASAPAAR